MFLEEETGSWRRRLAHGSFCTMEKEVCSWRRWHVSGGGDRLLEEDTGDRLLEEETSSWKLLHDGKGGMFSEKVARFWKRRQALGGGYWRQADYWRRWHVSGGGDRLLEEDIGDRLLEEETGTWKLLYGREGGMFLEEKKSDCWTSWKVARGEGRLLEKVAGSWRRRRQALGGGCRLLMSDYYNGLTPI